METPSVSGSKGPSRRVFLSASAVTAVAAPIVSQATAASAATSGTHSPLPQRLQADDGLQQLLSEIDPNRIQATIERLIQFGTRHTASSQTDPVQGIGAAYAWVFQQMQAIADDSNGNMTVQQQTFTQQP